MTPISRQDVGMTIAIDIGDAKALPKTGRVGNIHFFKLTVVIHKDLQGHPFARDDQVGPAVPVEVGKSGAGDNAYLVEMNIVGVDTEMAFPVIEVEVRSLRHTKIRAPGIGKGSNEHIEI